MDWARSMHGSYIKVYKISVVNLKGIDYLGKIGTDG